MISELPFLTPTNRFSNRADNYFKYSPGYPQVITSFLEQQLGLQKDARIADIGSGTGLFAELLLQKGFKVICIEPDEEMRRAAQARLGHYSNFISRRHRAESTGLRSTSIDLITVAQAFHWLNPEDTRKEFQRVLKPGSYAILAWNIQKTDTPFLQAYADLKETYRIDEVPATNTDEQQITSFFGL